MLEKLSPHEAVRVRRERRRLTQAELGALLGVSDKQVSAIENDKSGVSLDVALGLARELEIPVEVWAPEAKPVAA